MPTPFQHGCLKPPSIYNRAGVHARRILEALENERGQRLKSRERGILEYFLANPGYRLSLRYMAERFYEDADLVGPEDLDFYRIEMSQAVSRIRKFLGESHFTIDTQYDSVGRVTGYIFY
jgi:DNA-binding response OmpR family regulator